MSTAKFDIFSQNSDRIAPAVKRQTVADEATARRIVEARNRAEAGFRAQDREEWSYAPAVDTAKTVSAFDAFYADGGATPGNAARLAAEDHKSQGLKNWAFIDGLREAGRLSDAAPDLLYQLYMVLPYLEQLRDDEAKSKDPTYKAGVLDALVRETAAVIANAETA